MSMKPLHLTAGTVLVALLGTLLPLVLCGPLAACAAPTVADSAKPGCDRNGDREQRVAC
jgi:hypothetical protein